MLIENSELKKNLSIFPLTFANVGLKKNNLELLNNLNITIKEKGITVLIGPNGSGKSLFIRLIHGLEKPTTGKITFNSIPLNKQIKKQQAFVFQNPILLRRTVLENLSFVDNLFKKKGLKKCFEILDLIGLKDKHNFPARKLSGGEKQCLALGRALIIKPKLLFLDEPTANLDNRALKKIEEIVIKENKNGTKIIFITHDLMQAKRLANEIIFFYKGTIVEAKKAEVFFKNPTCKDAENFLNGKILI